MIINIVTVGVFVCSSSRLQGKGFEFGSDCSTWGREFSKDFEFRECAALFSG